MFEAKPLTLAYSTANQPRSYQPTNSRSRPAISGVSCPGNKRHRQLPPKVAGVFIRASFPSPNKSCAGNTTVSATEAISARISAQFISRPSVFR